MKKRYYVIDGANHQTSFNGVKERAEFFTTENAAISRAAQLAECEPGNPFYVAQSLHVATSPIAPAKIVSTSGK